jgi:probable rRNA maturation factor
MPVLARHEGQLGRRFDSRATCALIKLRAQRMLDALGMPNAQLSVLLCDDRVMRVLNREHRAIDRSTDVLAFAMGEGEPIVSVAPMLGDVVISLPTVVRQAQTHGCTIDYETCLLLAHGLLHVLGFDHATRTEERRMTARTHMLMTVALGVGRSVEKQGRPSAKARRPSATAARVR